MTAQLLATGLTLLSSVLAICSAVWKLKGAIGRAESMADQLDDTVRDLRTTLREQQKENHAAHTAIYGRLAAAENRLTVLETRSKEERRYANASDDGKRTL